MNNEVKCSAFVCCMLLMVSISFKASSKAQLFGNIRGSAAMIQVTRCRLCILSIVGRIVLFICLIEIDF